MKSPNIIFVGIGAPRCGTTWISQCISEHPELYFPINKEMNFFTPQKIYGNKSSYDLEGINGYYKRFGDTKGLKTGEFSTTYFESKKTAESIKKSFPRTKIILAIRNPVERFISGIEYLKDYHRCKITPERIKREENLGYYYKNLQPWVRLFGKKNIHIIIYEDIKKNPKKVVKSLYNFLGVKANFIPPSLNKKINPRGIPKSKILNMIQKNIAKIAPMLRKMRLFFLIDFLRGLGLNRIYWIIWRKNLRPQEKKKPTSMRGLAKLKQGYKSDIEKLEKFLKRDLSIWK
jgi:hypothetical protein